jgi:hypothetical protein
MPKWNKKTIKKFRYKTAHKFRTELCDNDLTFEECELAILRHAVDETEKIQGATIASSEDIKKMLKIVEEFIIHKKLVCYGGTAINNILPVHAQFYDRDLEIPDYDFFSPNALDDAKELADIYYKNGYVDVEAKSGVHYGTFKVFVNFIPIADITMIHKELYNSIFKESILVAGIRYAPPNYLRMAMFLELSRPAGDVSRWEKVLKRLTLLNKYYPLETKAHCNQVDFQRKMESNIEDSERLYVSVRDSFIDQGVIFFGGYATSLYSKYMPQEQQHLVRQIPDFDVLSEDPEKCAMIIQETLQRERFKKIKIIKHPAIGEIVPEHIQIQVDKEILAFIYKPIACHSYNTIEVNNKQVNIATIDTILAFYLSFIYAGMDYYDKDRLLCMAKFLFDVEQKNRLEQRGLLKRFSIACYGKQPTLESTRAEKAEKYKELKGGKDKHQYEMWFLKYIPDQEKKSNRKNIEEKPNKKDKIENLDKPEKINDKDESESQGILFDLFTSKKTQKKRKNNVQLLNKANLLRKLRKAK